MLRLFTAKKVFLFLGILAFSCAETECESGSCEASDDIALIQGMLEVTKMQAGGIEVRSNAVPSTRGNRDTSKLEETNNTASEDSHATSTTTTTPVPFAVKGQAVKLNAAGDIDAFFSAIRFDGGLFVLFFVSFLFLQRCYPNMYAHRWMDGDGEKYLENEDLIAEQQGYFGWIGKVMKTPLLIQDREKMVDRGESNVPPSVEETSGLDAAMLMKFNELALELLVAIGTPACILGIPMYAYAGGGFAKADRLSWAGIGNVVYNNTKSAHAPMEQKWVDKLDGVQWIFYVVAATVWVVILYVQWRMSCYQRMFIKARMKWLERMPAPRSKTVLVQGIDEGYNSDVKLKNFFEDLFGQNTVESAFVIRSTGYLNSYIKAYQSLKAEIDTLEKDTTADKSEVIASKKAELIEKANDVAAEQKKVLEDDYYCTTNGFVTFKDRRDCERALGVRLSQSDDIWVLDTPPAVTDVRYQDFEYSDETAETSQLIGYAAMAGLFFAFMPIVIGISHISKSIESTPWINDIVVATGFKSTVDGVLATVGLTIMMSMLPTFLSWIFQAFYTLKANRWGQQQIQNYYFWFLVLFVLLTTSVGTNLQGTLAALAQSPFKVFSLLAEMMPVTTHFYLNYCVLQPMTHGMNLTRYIQIIKYWLFKRIADSPEDARRMSEPEDQDYYGIGSRSARFTLMLLIGLVFGTICPLMNVVCLYNFIVCRFIYGYLLAYQENRKDDMGGVHWCMQMHHLQQGLAIYLIMMTGVLSQRCETLGPCIISAISFLWWLIAYRQFVKTMQWEKLPYASMIDMDGKEKESFQMTRRDGKEYGQEQLTWKP